METVGQGAPTPRSQHAGSAADLPALPDAGAAADSPTTRDWRRLARVGVFALSLVALLSLILTFQFLPSRYDLREGDISVYTLKSPQKVVYVSQIRTREAKQAAATDVPDEYALSPNVADLQRQRAVQVLSRISEIRFSVATLEAKRDSVNKISDLVLAPSSIDDVLAMSEADWQMVSSETLRILDRLMKNQISERQLEDVKASIPALIGSTLADRQSNTVNQLTRNFVKPNYLIDAEATAKKKREAQDRVEPVRLTIERGETILRDGEKVTAEHLEKLQASGLRNPTFRWRDVLAMVLLSGLLIVALASYVYSFKPLVADDTRRLVLLGLLIGTATLAAKLILAGRDVDTYYGYLYPIAVVPILVAVLLDGELALASTVALAVVMGLITSNSFEMATLTVVGGTVGLLTVSRLERFTTLLRAGAYISLANFAVILGFYLFGNWTDTDRLLKLLVASGANGLLSAVIARGALYLLGQVFGITTAMGMLERAHPSQPLFRRLLTEAPGSYHHSVVVANLAERAAEVVGADALLCRIGAYYHDVGKLARPYAFIENQVDGQNVHDQLDPVTSARIITAHVADGQALARRYGVPRRVQDMIAQHHGTGLVGYFYRRACQSAGHPVDDRPFRYLGPRPQSREAGIMLLADSVEAAVRASRDHSPENVSAIIRKIVQERIDDGQLDECDLTLRDLDRIRRTFATVLQGIFHPRIEYPTPPVVARDLEPSDGMLQRQEA